jgi:hypothetical protein
MVLVYTVTAGAVVDSDVKERKLTLNVNGVEVSTTSFPKETTSFGELKFADNDKVVLTLVDVDNSGNSSEPAVTEFTTNDTIPPAKPGEFGVTLTRQE